MVAGGCRWFYVVLDELNEDFRKLSLQSAK